jgi:hypothetical protein
MTMTTTKATPTPGPWQAMRSVTCGHLRATHNYRQNPHDEWTDADIALINAAPDLLAACEAMLRGAGYESGQHEPGLRELSVPIAYFDAIRAAIAKAKP